MKTITKLTLLLLAAILPAIAPAHDFEVDNMKYTITSDTTVELTKHAISTYSLGYSDAIYDLENFYDIDIPSYVTYNNVNYIVTAIGDWACYTNYNPEEYGGDGKIYLNLNIIVPETVTSIGYNAFGGSGIDLINIFCLAKTPPMMNDEFSANLGDINLFVSSDAYHIYEEFNQNNHYFTAIYATDGEWSNPPRYSEEFLYQSFNWRPYGCAAEIYSNNNSIVYTREVFNLTGAYDHINTQKWEQYHNQDSLYFYFDTEYSSGHHPDGWMVQFFVIEEGKSPSRITACGDLIAEKSSIFDFKWNELFDFLDKDITYNILNNHAEVTYQYYYPPEYCDYDVYIYYSGDVIIPSTATHHNYHNNTYTSYPVTAIGNNAFTDYYYNQCIDGLTSVTLPASITSIGEKAFGNSPNLEYIKCMGSSPPTASHNSFDDGVYQNTTLYVPMGTIDAYRSAEGWKNFQHIVGFYDYDFEADGIYYKKTNSNEVIVSCDEEPYQGIINIPTSVTVNGVTYNVTGINDGAFTNADIQCLTLPVTLTTVGNNVFSDCHIGSLIINGNGAWTAGALNCDVDNLYVMSGVTGIEGLMINPLPTVYSYSTLPPTCSQETFTGYDAELHVPASALAAYFTAPYWNYFINITSDAVEPTGISLNKDSVEVLVGNQLALTATSVPANATPNNAIIWTSSDASIATVTDGVITAVHVGECDIKAYLLDKVAVCHVTVTEIAPTEISLSQEFAKLEIGSQLTLTATVLPDDATDKYVTWTTTNANVATVDDQGIVTAVGQGECLITATCRDKQASCHIIVVDHFIFITLDEHEMRLLPNHMAILTPSVMPENTPLVVTSSDPTVAAARMANGKIQVVGIKEGRTTIKVNSTDGYAEADSCLVKVYTLRGDVNCDGFVNISDVTSLISYLLSNNSEGISMVNADTNNDGNVNIGDVTQLIRHLLSGEELDPKEDPDENTLTFTVNGVTFTMVAVEGGTFTMGGTPEQGDDALDWEYPLHQVTLSNYAIGQTEVTQALWEAVTGTNPSRFHGRPENPVELVDWNDCQTFITQLNALTGKQFRLPTEAEWEFAARGGNKSQGYKYAGSNDFEEVGWHSENCNTTQPVGSKKANELGIYDMSGNVWEWCQDYWGDYTSDPQTDPTGPETGDQRIRRGVGWNGSIPNGRVSHRSSREETYKYNSQGLRLAL